MDEKVYLVVFGSGESYAVEGYEVAEVVAYNTVAGFYNVEEDSAQIVDLSTGEIVETFEYV